MPHATGTFVPTLTPRDPEPQDADPSLSRMVLSKSFQGDLAGTGSGQMLAVRTAIDGSAGYVALERVTGTLEGRSGTFALQHHGIMTRGTPELAVTVVPDSGTDGLTGISGTMAIIIDEGGHRYDLDYALPPLSG